MLKRVFLLLAFVALFLSAGAVEIKRKPAYKSGETLECVFYFNWKFIWVKAGGAKLIIRDTIYNNRKAQYMSLLSSTNEAADAFLKMRDTLTTIFTPGDVRPLYYKKVSVQGRHEYFNEVKYDYTADGKVNISQRYVRDGELRVAAKDTRDTAVYDMMSMLAYARTFDFSTLKKGQRLTYPVATGKRVEEQCLIYRGTTKVKANDELTYDCLEISLVKMEGGKEKTIINFFVTNDDNHLPILLDLALNFGSAKARLSRRTGLLYPLLPSK